MHADFSVELGPDDPALELPWFSDDPSVRYFNLRNSPELVRQIPEAVAYPALGTFLARVNAPTSSLETAKCDVWQTAEISPEEEIFGAGQKFVSYVDILFTDKAARGAFARHEEFAGDLCRLLARAPDTPATIELIIRRCYITSSYDTSQDLDGVSYSRPSPYRETTLDAGESVNLNACQNPGAESTGFFFTVYITGFGNNNTEAQRNWEVTIALLQHALMQLTPKVVSLGDST